MTVVYIVAYDFTDDPTTIFGIFTEYSDARACLNNNDDARKFGGYIATVEINKEFKEGVNLSNV